MPPTTPGNPDYNAAAEALAADVAAGHAARQALAAGRLPAAAAWHQLPPALVLVDAETRRVAARYPILYEVVESPVWSGMAGPVVGGLVVPAGEVATITWRALTGVDPDVVVDSGTIHLATPAAGVPLSVLSGGGVAPEPVVSDAQSVAA